MNDLELGEWKTREQEVNTLAEYLDKNLARLKAFNEISRYQEFQRD